jgi:hypothetical protein
MSAAKFTPGPWTYQNTPTPWFHINAGGLPVCSIHTSTGFGRTVAEHFCNARLIAAAPELLHALYTALPYVEDALQDPAYKPASVRAALKLIHAALKQAGSK